MSINSISNNFSANYSNFSNNSANDSQKNNPLNNNCAPDGSIAGKAQYSEAMAKEMAMQGKICPSSNDVHTLPYNPNGSNGCKPETPKYPQTDCKPHYDSYNCNPYAQMMKMKMQEQCQPKECQPKECQPQEPQKECQPQESKMDKAKDCSTNPVEKPIEKPVESPYKELNKTLKNLNKTLDTLSSLINKENKLISKLDNITKKLDDIISKLSNSKTPATPTEPVPISDKNSIEGKIGQLINDIKSLIDEIKTSLKGDPKKNIAKPTPTPDKNVKEPNDLNQEALNLAVESLELALSVLKKFAESQSPDKPVTIQANMWSKMDMKA